MIAEALAVLGASTSTVLALMWGTKHARCKELESALRTQATALKMSEDARVAERKKNADDSALLEQELEEFRSVVRECKCGSAADLLNKLPASAPDSGSDPSGTLPS